MAEFDIGKLKSLSFSMCWVNSPELKHNRVFLMWKCDVCFNLYSNFFCMKIKKKNLLLT